MQFHQETVQLLSNISCIDFSLNCPSYTFTGFKLARIGMSHQVGYLQMPLKPLKS